MHTIIEDILSYLSANPNAFAKSIGIHPTQVYDLKSGKIKHISPTVADKIISVYPCFNRLWLLTGEGKMLNVEDSISQNHDSDEDKNRPSRLIPFYDAETSGGYSGIVGSSTSEVEMVGYIQAGGWFDSKETAAIRHVGDSMVEYPSGCILAVREVTERRLLVPGRNYVIETSEFRVTKRVQRGSSPNTIALYSSNNETYPDGRLVHEPFEVEFEDIRRIYSVLGYIVNQSGEFRLIKP